MTDLDQRRDLTLELLCKLILSSVLASIHKFKLLDSHIILLVGGFEYIGASTRANLLLKPDVLNVYPEVVLILLELLAQDVASLLSLSLRYHALLG